MLTIYGLKFLCKEGNFTEIRTKAYNFTSAINTIKELRMSRGIILEGSSLVGVIGKDGSVKRVDSSIRNIGEYARYILDDEFIICGYSSEGSNYSQWVYTGVATLDEVHLLIEQEDIFTGYIMENGRVTHTIDETATLYVCTDRVKY